MFPSAYVILWILAVSRNTDALPAVLLVGLYILRPPSCEVLKQII